MSYCPIMLPKIHTLFQLRSLINTTTALLFLYGIVQI